MKIVPFVSSDELLMAGGGGSPLFMRAASLLTTTLVTAVLFSLSICPGAPAVICLNAQGM